MPDTPFGGSLGAPGTRVTARLDLSTDFWAYILKTLVIIIAADIVIFCIMMIGWLSGSWIFVPLTTTTFALIISWMILALGRPPSGAVQFIIGNLWLIGIVGGIVLGAPFMPWSLWRWLNTGTMRQIGEAIKSAWGLPWWAWFVLLVAWSIGAARKLGKIALGIIVGGSIIWTAANFEQWPLFAQAWSRLRYLLIPYLWPVIGACMLLVMVMIQQQLFPNLEWLARPVSLEELREIGFFGLLAPRLFSLPPEEPLPERHVEVEFKTETGRRYATLPDSPEAREFYDAVKRGETFALRTARKYGVTRAQFNTSIRDVFVDRGWANWKDDRYPQQGVDLTDEGIKVIEHLVLGDTTPDMEE